MHTRPQYCQFSRNLQPKVTLANVVYLTNTSYLAVIEPIVAVYYKLKCFWSVRGTGNISKSFNIYGANEEIK